MNKIFSIIFAVILLSANVFSQAVGTQAPNFTHNTLDHGQISLSDYHGKVVYLFFFAWN